MGYKTKRLFTSCQKRVSEADPHVRALYLFNAISLVGGAAYGLYYGVFLYKSTFSLSVLAMDGLLGGFGTWIGYLLGVILIRKYGYSRCIKISFGLMAVVAFGTALIAHQIHEWFMVLALIKAIPLGMYLSNVDTLMIREMQSGSRNKFLPIMIKETKGSKYDIDTLRKRGVVKQRPFVENGKNTPGGSPDAKTLAAMLEKEQILPNHQLILWGLLLSGLKHYGNDFGFSATFSEYLSQAGYKNNFNNLQLTKHNQDGRNFMEFSNSVVYGFEENRNKFFKRPVNVSRVTDLCSVFLHVGQQRMKYNWDSFCRQRIQARIKMGDIRL